MSLLSFYRKSQGGIMGNRIKSHLPDLNMIQRKSETGYMVHLGNIFSLFKRTNVIWAYTECSFQRKKKVKRQFKCLWINFLWLLDSILYSTARGGPSIWVQRCIWFLYLLKALSIIGSKTKNGMWLNEISTAHTLCFSVIPVNDCEGL